MYGFIYVCLDIGRYFVIYVFRVYVLSLVI